MKKYLNGTISKEEEKFLQAYEASLLAENHTDLFSNEEEKEAVKSKMFLFIDKHKKSSKKFSFWRTRKKIIVTLLLFAISGVWCLCFC